MSDQQQYRLKKNKLPIFFFSFSIDYYSGGELAFEELSTLQIQLDKYGKIIYEP